MLYGILADLVMLAHFTFVLFVVAGGVLVVWRPAIAWLHLPCALYAAGIELVGWICPLTPLEQTLRRAAGAGEYAGGFIQHYIGGILYPANWDDIHLWLGLGLVAVNAALYAVAFSRRRRGGTARSDTA